MELVSTYSVRIKDFSHIFDKTAELYRDAADFFISVCMREWDTVSAAGSPDRMRSAVESLTVTTKARPSVKYDFGEKFYKFPSYLRRAAIAFAVGAVSSYRTRVDTWKGSDPKTRGKRPGLPKAGRAFPVLYRGNMFVRTGTDTAKIKVFINKTWDWLEVRLRGRDVKYIARRCGGMKGLSPTLRKKGKRWHLCFPFSKKVALGAAGTEEKAAERVLSADLGINSACTCCVMEKDGTVTAREFLSLAGEYDCLYHALGRVRKAQMHGAKHMPKLWGRVNGINRDIAIKTALSIVDMAVRHDVDVIVMEHLDLSGRKRGPKKQRLHHWKARFVHTLVEHMAHARGIRVSTVCARNTSRLAFDGSGRVLRGNESLKTGGSYSLCEFSTGKVYNCDLNAAYNIGARYFVRAYTKSLPETERQRLEAEVPSAVKRSTCTLSTLISLCAVLHAMA